MRVGLKKTGIGRSTPSGEDIITIRQGQTLKTTAVMKKSRNRPRKAILGAANAAIDHQMMTLRTRPGPGIGSVSGQVMRMYHQIAATISITGADPWGSHLKTELLTNQRKQGMTKGLTGMAITTGTIALTIMDVLTLLNLTA
jgi:hypothetical protein